MWVVFVHDGGDGDTHNKIKLILLSFFFADSDDSIILYPKEILYKMDYIRK